MHRALAAYYALLVNGKLVPAAALTSYSTLVDEGKQVPAAALGTSCIKLFGGKQVQAGELACENLGVKPVAADQQPVASFHCCPQLPVQAA